MGLKYAVKTEYMSRLGAYNKIKAAFGKALTEEEKLSLPGNRLKFKNEPLYGHPHIGIFGDEEKIIMNAYGELNNGSHSAMVFGYKILPTIIYPVTENDSFLVEFTDQKLSDDFRKIMRETYHRLKANKRTHINSA